MSTTYDLPEQIKRAPLDLIAARIKYARERYGTHDKLAAQIGTNRQHIIKLEKAKHRPRADTLTRIAEATGREIVWFLDPEGDPNPFPGEQAA